VKVRSTRGNEDLERRSGLRGKVQFKSQETRGTEVGIPNDSLYQRARIACYESKKKIIGKEFLTGGASWTFLAVCKGVPPGRSTKGPLLEPSFPVGFGVNPKGSSSMTKQRGMGR